MKKIKTIVFSLVLVMTPLMIHAVTFDTLMTKAGGWLKTILSLLMGIAFLFFLLAIIKLIRAEGDDRDEAKKGVMWSIIALFVLVSIWGIVTFLRQTVEITGQDTVTVPELPRSSR